MKRTIIYTISIIVALTLLLTTSDTGSDDGSAGNCLFGLLLFLCWLKGGK